MFLLLLFLDTWGQGRKGSPLALRAEKMGKLTHDRLATWNLEDEEEQSWFKFRVCRALSFGGWVWQNWEG